MKNPILEKIRKNSTIKQSDLLAESAFFNDINVTKTDIPAFNIALYGDIDGGISRGLTVVAGPSRHFKSLICLIMAKAYLESKPNSILIFMDSEFGTPKAYFESLNIPLDRVFHVPITDIEQLKHELVTQLNAFDKNDEVIVVIDSVGNLASKKELDDALLGKSTVDMTRAKAFKSLGRMITPLLTVKDIPMFAVGHVYDTLEMYSKQVLSGGTGLMLSADNVWFIGKQQEKDSDKELVGFNFIINIEKSRHVKEKSKIPVCVTFDNGISKWSGLMDIAIESGHVIKPSIGWYQKINIETGEIDGKKYRIKETNTNEFWGSIINCQFFKDFIKTKYKLSVIKMISDDDIVIEDISDEVE